jgi:beta-lactam-binding protein with PASTA domain
MKALFKNLIAMVLLSGALFGGVLLFIHFYTGHGEENAKVPEVMGLKINKAIEVLEKEGFKYTVTDTVYQDGQELLAIVDQNPDAGLEVKQGRRVYLVINAPTVPKVRMPDLAYKTSFDQAVRVLRNTGLKLGKKIKRPHEMVSDPDSEPVLEQRIAGDSTIIKPGTLVKRNSQIDLVVGTMIRYSDEAEESLNQEGESP